MPYVPAQASLSKIKRASSEEQDESGKLLEGKRLVTADRKEVRETYTSWTQAWTSKVRIFYCNPTLIASATDDNQIQSPFFTLPPELRLEILELALHSPKQTLHMVPGHRAEMQRTVEKIPDPTAALLLTCKRLYFEFLPVALKLKTFPVQDLPQLHVLHYTPESFKLLSEDAETAPRLNIFFDAKGVVSRAICITDVHALDAVKGQILAGPRGFVLPTA